jgi:O-succinylhomoserine sulfhydrylase
MYSATKHIDGQGRVLAGALLGSFSYIYEKLIPFIRHTGPSLSAFNAWVLVKSLETMELRVSRMCENAQAIAEFLESRKEIKKIMKPLFEDEFLLYKAGIGRLQNKKPNDNYLECIIKIN